MATKRVIILDDVQAMRDMLGDVVETEGHRVTYSGADPKSVERVLAEPPDLLFLNLSLQARWGVDVYGALRADARTRALPIILVTVQRAHTVSQKIGSGSPVRDERLATLYQPFAIADAVQAMRSLLT